MPIIHGKLADGRQPLLKVKISNDFGLPTDFSSAPLERIVSALVDTGATSGALDETVCLELGLEGLGLVEFLGAGMDHPLMVTKFGCSLSFFPDHRVAKLAEWPDIVSLSGVRLHGRPYQAVLGMDVIAKGKLTIENEGQAIRFEF